VDDHFVQKFEGKRRKKASLEQETKKHKHPISAKHIMGEGRSQTVFGIILQTNCLVYCLCFCQKTWKESADWLYILEYQIRIYTL